MEQNRPERHDDPVIHVTGGHETAYPPCVDVSGPNNFCSVHRNAQQCIWRGAPRRGKFHGPPQEEIQMRRGLVLAAPLFLCACQVAVGRSGGVTPVVTAPTEVEFVVPSGAAAALPFSPVVRVGNILYLAGQLGTDPATGALVPGGIAAETRQAMENIKALVIANGSSMDRVVKCTVMLADINEWAAMNAVYVTFFSNHKPARSAFGTSGLARNGRAEIECIAVAGDLISRRLSP